MFGMTDCKEEGNFVEQTGTRYFRAEHVTPSLLRTSDNHYAHGADDQCWIHRLNKRDSRMCNNEDFRKKFAETPEISKPAGLVRNTYYNDKRMPMS